MNTEAGLTAPADPGELLHALWDILESEATLLDSGEADEIQDVVERKDSLCRQISLHPGLVVQPDGTLNPPLSDENRELLERCNSKNVENGERISRRRQLVQERLARLSTQGTYGSSGAMDHRPRGNWSTQA